MYYYLSESQSVFYDRIVEQYFSEDGLFTGSVYQSARYELIVDEDEMDQDENRRFVQQRNLYDFMRRLLVKRFESSIRSSEKSIERFIKVHEIVLGFIERIGGKYILDQELIEKIYEYDEEDIFEILEKFEKRLLERKLPKNTTVYKVNEFQKSEEFLEDIQKDLDLFKRIKSEIEEENLVEEDPKREKVYSKIKEIVENDTKIGRASCR